MAWGSCSPVLAVMEVAQGGPVLLPHPRSDARVPAQASPSPGCHWGPGAEGRDAARSPFCSSSAAAPL